MNKWERWAEVFHMYDWHRRQLSFIRLPVFLSMPFAFASSSGGSYNSGLLIRHLNTCVVVYDHFGLLCSSVLLSPLIFSLRMSHFSFVFNFFSILYLVNFYCPPFNKPKSTDEYSNNLAFLFSIITPSRRGDSCLVKWTTGKIWLNW